jgi:hypothetical protein
MPEQEKQLKRVEQRIGGLVQDFIVERYHTKPRFHVAELIEYVCNETLAAPTSPDRMLRKLRTDGFCAYKILDRRNSLYEITYVMPKREWMIS